MSRIGALELRDAVLDEGSFRSWDAPPVAVARSDEYRRELAEAEAATGLDESVITGEGLVFGGAWRWWRVSSTSSPARSGSPRPNASPRRTARGDGRTTPLLLASPSSGGTRMQEGTVAFLQMVKIAAAVELHKRAHLPYLVYLRHPTTGGVRAGGLLGHITVAEPGALIGFLGPRVYEHLYGEPFPSGIRPRRISRGTASSMPSSRSTACAASWTAR